ncbi:GrpB family protein [Halomarina litorea]|uniref:GrpB family protein n=1 Tax=Halomarina litorea TaxID=2961595 RepID=UPI0020C47EB4|nr:GrpB family protein [Halomarina sp. BCD28]
MTDGGSEPQLGLARGTVELVDHRESWHDAADREADRLRDLLGERALAIGHVGSTAVRELAAKPILDLSVAVGSLAVARDCVPLLEPAGYDHRPDDPVPDREFLARGSQDSRTHYLTLTPLGSGTWCDHLAFRDHLREHPETRRRYERVKRELAVRCTDRAAYTEAKSGFVERVLRDARR